MPTRPIVPVESIECQTEIGMDYFDRAPSLQKQDSRGSGQSRKVQVGGGGSIVKPPRHSGK
mgnify:CR=1 FL=1